MAGKTSRADDFGWAIPFMRSGYAGRGIVYTVIGGFAVWAIWQGGSAGGVTDALASLETTPFGSVILWLIVIGMAAYAIWRLLDAYFDLEAYGDDAKGIVSRVAMVVTGLTHLLIGAAAFSLAAGSGGGSGSGGEGSGSSSRIVEATAAVMSVPFGRWLVGIAGVLTVCAGIYYFVKAARQSYLEHLRGNKATARYNTFLRIGVAAQGVVVCFVGAFLISAALLANPGEAGGLGQAFSWISGQPYGQVLVTILALGLICFAFFCFVNAAYRIVPRASDDKVETLGQRLKAKTRQAQAA